MRRFTRFTMLFAGFLALQINALGGGVACLLAASSGHVGAIGARMAVMSMPIPQSPRGQSRTAGAIAAVGANQASSQSPCQESGAPRSSCQSMTPCAAAFTSAPMNGGAVNVSTPSVRIARVEVAPTSHSLSPDLPPPKA